MCMVTMMCVHYSLLMPYNNYYHYAECGHSLLNVCANVLRSSRNGNVVISMELRMHHDWRRTGTLLAAL